MKKYSVWLAAICIGIIDALLLRVFELCVNDGTDEIWNHLFRSETYRWVVVPLAVVLSIVLTMVIRKLRETRIAPLQTDLMAEIKFGPTSISKIGVILGIGLMSLLAGASLGPEATLMTASAAIGVWVAGKAKLTKTTKLMVLASIGALLVAFLSSVVMILAPLLLLYKQKQLKPVPVGVVLLAGLSSFGVLQLIDHENPGYGTAPPLPHLAGHDFIVALVAGFVTTVLALVLHQLIALFARLAKAIDFRLPWPQAAALFGLGLGALYLIAGQTIEFSGSTGSQQLVAGSAQYSAAALAGLVVAKLLATAWSNATGYRGGLVFPSIYIGVALGLLIGHLNGGWAGAGAMVGGISGMLSGVTGSPVMAAVFVLALMPIRLVPVALLAIIGSAVGSRLLKRVIPEHQSQT